MLQVKTVIFNILRGSGSRGGSGINPSRDNIIRPLIRVSKKENNRLETIGCFLLFCKVFGKGEASGDGIGAWFVGKLSLGVIVIFDDREHFFVML